MNHHHFSKTIGIIGGAGPMASAFLYSEILRTCQELYLANDYDEFPEIVLISHPFKRGDKSKIQEELISCLKRTEECRAQVICIASHSFHGFLPNTLPKGFINLIEEGLAAAKSCPISKALILAAPLTISLKLYERSDIECIYPDASDQEKINALIREVAGGTFHENQSKHLMSIIEHNLANQPFDGVIIACTELPLIHAKAPIFKGLPIIDTIQVIARRLLQLEH